MIAKVVVSIGDVLRPRNATIVRTIIIFFIGVVLSAICYAAPEPRVFIIPLYPVEQTVSENMRLRLAALEKDDAFRMLSTWDRLTELPSWVFKPEKREIAYVFGKPVVIHGYRYAVIDGGNRKLIIVRAGGLDGSYEIFVPKRKSERKAAAVRHPVKWQKIPARRTEA